MERWRSAVAVIGVFVGVSAVVVPGTPAAAQVGELTGVPYVTTDAPAAILDDPQYSAVVPGMYGASGRAGVATIGGDLVNTAVIESDDQGGYLVPGASGLNTGLRNDGFGTGIVDDAQPIVSGDFNGDHRTDLALLIPGSPDNEAIVGFATGTGAFNAVGGDVGEFASFLDAPGVRIVPGDFNGDGRTDIALVGGQGWFTVPVAFSLGNGSFSVTNTVTDQFPGLATVAGAKPYAGDFNHDGRTDIALLGGAQSSTVPVAFSNGDGSFTVKNTTAGSFPFWAAGANVRVVTGDFNGDDRTDLALVGGAGWTTIPVAFSNGNGTFAVTNLDAGSFPFWGSGSLSEPVPGDFNGDGRQDIALLNNDPDSGWHTIPVAFSRGDGSFTITNDDVPNFALWSRDPTARAFAEDLDGDGRTDIALTGGQSWFTVPTARSVGDGTFTITNPPVGVFADDTMPGAVNG